MRDLQRYAAFAAGVGLLLAAAYGSIELAERSVRDGTLRRDAELIVHHWADHVVTRYELESRVLHNESPEHSAVMHSGAASGHASHHAPMPADGHDHASGGEPGHDHSSHGAFAPAAPAEGAAPVIGDIEMRAFHRDRHVTSIEGWALYGPHGAVTASGGGLAEGGAAAAAAGGEDFAAALAGVLADPSVKWTTTGGRSTVFISLVKDGAPSGAIRADLNQVRTQALIGRSLNELSAIIAVIVLLAGGAAAFVIGRQVRARLRTQDELKKREEELSRQNEHFDVALENMSQGLCLFDGDKKLVVCNQRYIDMYELPHELAKPGTPFHKILEQRVASGNYVDGTPESYIEERLAAADERIASTRLQELRDGRVIAIAQQPLAGGAWVVTHEDITELQRVQAKIAYMANHDALTDLPNRDLLRERIQEALTGEPAGVAVLCVDLDRFKSINDTLGHPTGDALLKAVAERLRGCVGEGDTVARFGGDEFAIVQLAEHLPDDASTLAARLCEAIRQPFDLAGHQAVVEASVGIAIAPDDGDEPDQLLKNADMALYGAKSDARGSFCFFESEMDARMKARRQLEIDLRNGIKDGEFEVHYQPVMGTKSQRMRGFEALVRWRHPERGLVPPDEFISAAEDTALILPLGEWVLRQACADAAGWPGDYSVAVNLSPIQFKSGNLVAGVVSALAASGLSPRRLELEITESALLTDSEATLQTLHRLRALGVKIAMDDFGTGYSSLSYLLSFPFDKIKIDRSFVSGLSHSEGAVAVLRAVANLGSSLGMITTAEGVETEEQLRRIRAEGYQEIQGYLLGPPRRAEEIVALYFANDERKRAAG